MAAECPGGVGLVVRRLRVADRDVVWLRSIIEAYEGLAILYGSGDGVISLLSPESRAQELDGLLRELGQEADVQRLPLF